MLTNVKILMFCLFVVLNWASSAENCEQPNNNKRHLDNNDFTPEVNTRAFWGLIVPLVNPFLEPLLKQAIEVAKSIIMKLIDIAPGFFATLYPKLTASLSSNPENPVGCSPGTPGCDAGSSTSGKPSLQEVW